MTTKLITCLACNNQISNKATQCPHCGHPHKPPTEFSLFKSLIYVSLAFYAITFFNDKSNDQKLIEIQECTARGVKYFKEIDSYPFLKSAPNIGKNAKEEAKERCEITTTAF